MAFGWGIVGNASSGAMLEFGGGKPNTSSSSAGEAVHGGNENVVRYGGNVDMTI